MSILILPCGTRSLLSNIKKVQAPFSEDFFEEEPSEGVQFYSERSVGILMLSYEKEAVQMKSCFLFLIYPEEFRIRGLPR